MSQGYGQYDDVRAGPPVAEIVNGSKPEEPAIGEGTQALNDWYYQPEVEIAKDPHCAYEDMIVAQEFEKSEEGVKARTEAQDEWAKMEAKWQEAEEKARKAENAEVVYRLYMAEKDEAKWQERAQKAVANKRAKITIERATPELHDTGQLLAIVRPTDKQNTASASGQTKEKITVDCASASVYKPL